MYAPLIHSATPVRHYDLDCCEATLYADVVAWGPIEYLYVLEVRRADGEPIMYVASERNKLKEQFEARGMASGSHFLCYYEGDAHYNCGASDDWADLHKFEIRALQLIAERLTRVGPPH